MFKYDKIKDTVVAEKVDSEAGVYAYKSNSHASEYEQLFQFYQGNLVQHYKYGIDPAIFYFKNDGSVNAAAGKTPNGTSVCRINYGTIEKHLNNFKLNSTLLQDLTELGDLKEFEERINYPIHVLLFQGNVHFSFYHELGHLIQKNELPEFINESHTTRGFNIQKHVYEIDSDTFAALSVSAHIYQFQEKHTLTLDSSADAITLVSLLSSAIFMHMISYRSYRVPFYDKVGSHPHAALRILHVIHTIADYYQRLFNLKSMDLVIDKKSVLLETLKYSESLCTHFYSSQIIDPIKDAIANHGTDLKAYYAELITLLNADKGSAILKRNKLAKK